MIQLMLLILFIWFCVKVVGVFLKLAGGAIKVVLGIVLVLALPALLVCLLLCSGIVLLAPAGLMMLLLFILGRLSE